MQWARLQNSDLFQGIATSAVSEDVLKFSDSHNSFFQFSFTGKDKQEGPPPQESQHAVCVKLAQMSTTAAVTELFYFF